MIFTSYVHQSLFVAAWLFVWGCSGQDKPSKPVVTDPAAASQLSPPVEQSATAVSGKADGSVGDVASRWRYEETVDAEGKPVYKASITSPQLLDFEFPYNGGSTVTLTLRKRASSTNVYIQVSKGQFNRSFQGGSAQVRFDQSAPLPYSFSAAANGSANVIFFDADQALTDRIKRSRTMRVDVEFAGQDKRQITFQTAGLRWNH